MATPQYRQGFLSQTDEREPTRLTVQGDFPDWLSGQLIRTLPAEFEIGDRSYNHWFDGQAMLAAFRFQDGRVVYHNKMLQSDTYKKNKERGEISVSEFATDPCESLFKRVKNLFSAPETTDNCCVNVFPLNDEAVVTTETTLPILFNTESLEPLRHLELKEKLKGPVTSPHPVKDYRTGRLYNYAVEYGMNSYYHVYYFEKGKETPDILCSIEVDRPAYMHSFGMSERYLILTEFPKRVNPLDMQIGGKPFIENYRWQPEKGTRFQIMDKEKGEVVRTVETEAFFSFHHVNAFEKDGTLHVDLITYADDTIIDLLYLDHLRNQPFSWASQLTRFLLDLNTGSLQRVTLSDTPLELPRFHDGKYGEREYRYVYGSSIYRDNNFLDSIAKIDVQHGAATVWQEAGAYPGEPIFIPRLHPDAEDDGVLLSVVLDTRKDSSFLLVLDARDLSELARAEMPHRLPFGFHGAFLP